MGEEMPVIPVNRVANKKIKMAKKWTAEEEETHRGLLTQERIIILSRFFCFEKNAPD
jgi:hypothetical protein